MLETVTNKEAASKATVNVQNKTTVKSQEQNKKTHPNPKVINIFGIIHSNSSITHAGFNKETVEKILSKNSHMACMFFCGEGNPGLISQALTRPPFNFMVQHHKVIQDTFFKVIRGGESFEEAVERYNKKARKEGIPVVKIV
jgi:hypothetical protein